jgi:hypothetical protein
MTDIPALPYSVISVAARWSTGSGKLAGPALKLKTLDIGTFPKVLTAMPLDEGMMWHSLDRTEWVQGRETGSPSRWQRRAVTMG